MFNGIFLVFISYNILCESIERIFEPINIHNDALIPVSITGLFVNMIGLVFFHDFHHHGGQECSHSHGHGHHHHEEQDEEQLDREENEEASHHHHHDHHDHTHHNHSHDHRNENLQGIFLHVLADALGSVGVIISSVLIKYYDLQIADPICSSIISILIIASVVPLIKSSSESLLLKSPLSKEYNRIISQMVASKHVTKVQSLQIWALH